MAAGCLGYGRPSPSLLSFQINKLAAAMSALQLAVLPGCPSYQDYLPISRRGASCPSSPWHSLGHHALLSPLELKSSHLETLSTTEF